jgi:hypothetical protein
MRRWARRARELYSRCYDAHPSEDAVQEAFHRVVTDADSLLAALDDDVQFSDATRTSGSLARIVLSRTVVDALRSELQDEVQKRLEAVRKISLPNGTVEQPSQEGTPDQLLLTPHGNARPDHQPHDTDSPVSMVSDPEEIIDDPFVVAPPIIEITEHTIVQEMHSSPSIQDSASSSATLLVEEEPKAALPHSPAVSVLDLQDLHTEESPTPPIHALPSVIPISDAQVLAEDDTSTTPTSLDPPTLLSDLGATTHRYDTLQRAFRDCSLALKELKRTLASSSPSSHTQTTLRQHLETALARIDDYAEDARVELEIRVADEELTLRGFEMVLSVPGALVDADARAEVAASARAFVDGTDEGVARALDKFGKKLGDVQHDVAVVKRAVHGLAMEAGEESGESVDGDKDAGSAGWTAWTAGLLGANATPSRSPTPAQTFGTVMTSPRPRHATTPENAPDRGPLAGLNLRIPMPSPSPRTHLGLGRALEGETRPRTLSAMYAVGGLRSSSVGLGVGLGGSPSPARARARGMGGASSLLRAGARGHGEVHDLGGVE